MLHSLHNATPPHYATPSYYATSPYHAACPSPGALLTLPSRLFYDNQLVEAADAGVTGALTAWSELPTQGLPLLVYGLEGLQCHEHDSPSFFNPPEALKVAQLIEALLAKGAVDGTEISTGDIGVVAPFRKQVQKLREMLRERGLAAVNVGTVDDYQGQVHSTPLEQLALTAVPDPDYGPWSWPWP